MLRTTEALGLDLGKRAMHLQPNDLTDFKRPSEAPAERLQRCIRRRDVDDLGPARGFAFSLLAGSTLWVALLAGAIQIGRCAFA